MYKLREGGDTDRRGNPIGDRILRRGIDTATGQRGYCSECEIYMPDGPDACLGYLDNVTFACCGHGNIKRAYVCFGGEPNEVVENPVCWYGQDAIDYFEAKE